MKFVKRFLLLLGALLLLAAVFYAGLFFSNYPEYKKTQREILTEAPENATELRVMSCNVRYIAPFDFKEKSWFVRASMLMQTIEKQTPTVIGFQEVTRVHYKYLCSSLPMFDSVIAYRDNSPVAEGCPVFYRTDLYTLIDKGSFWLSETPDKMSKSWGSQFNRVCSYVILETKADGKQFIVFNTHLDNRSEEARVNGIGVILDKIAQFGALPAVLIGDMNAKEDSLTYARATESFADARYMTDKTSDRGTYQNWGQTEKCIDYCFVSDESLQVNSFAVVTDTFNGVYPSDHNPLCISLSFKEE